METLTVCVCERGGGGESARVVDRVIERGSVGEMRLARLGASL